MVVIQISHREHEPIMIRVVESPKHKEYQQLIRVLERAAGHIVQYNFADGKR